MPPSAEYQTRQQNWRAQHAQLEKLFIRIGNFRLLLGLLAAVLIWLQMWWPAPVLAFLVLVVWHQKVIKRRKLAERALQFYKQALERLDDNWSGKGTTGDAYRDPNHVYADDLDLFGKGSLFELVCTARTSAGEKTLANWLLTPAALDVALARQQAVRELATKLDLREDMVLLGEDIRSNVNAEHLQQWGSAPSVVFPSYFRVATFALSLLGITLLILKLAGVLPLWPLLIVLAIDFAVIFSTRQAVAQITGAIETAAHDLDLLSILIARLEHEQFFCPHLQQLHSALQTKGTPASQRIKHLRRWMELLDSSDHILMRVLGPLLLWKQQLAAALEAWRHENGARVGAWVQALAELEALSSLATLAFERPDWAFPQFQPDTAALFSAKALRHPLLASRVSIANDVDLGATHRLLIVSGSNMSGKSTLLRAIGLNTVLAWCGAPVAAASLQISPLRLGASIRVSDSLQDNRSRFFAEISRLRQIVDLTKSSDGVLFLLDELLSGTNSHDRRIGAIGIVRGLLKGNSIGLLTTHDLALTEMDRDLQSQAANVHFEDRITNGTVEFDYRLLPGVVTHSNALELMRSIGLEI